MNTATSSTTAAAAFSWPAGFARIPEAKWVPSEVDEFGLRYHEAGGHSWYKNLEPTVAQVLTVLEDGKLLVDYSSGTGILTGRLLRKMGPRGGILNVDASAKFLRVALENFRDDERVGFRLLEYLRDEHRLQTLDEVVGPELVERGADLLTATNAIHLYYDLDDTLASWKRVLRPGAPVFVCSANLHNPAQHPGDWIIDETVASVNEIAADIVRREPFFEDYRATLDDPELMAAHTKLREKVFVPVRPLELYLDAFRDAGFDVLDTYTSTVFATVEDWITLLCTYHDGVLSWVGGSPKVDGRDPSELALLHRYFLIRLSMRRLFPSQDEFPCTWTYITCRA